MNAPDKIYLVRDAVNPAGIFDCVASKNPMFYDDIAYIHKDALLEWAKETEKSRMRVPIEAYNNEDYQAGFIDGFAKFRRVLIEKLESL